MAKVNRGKQFEQQIKKAFENVPNTSVYRLQDSMGGYAGVANICDFIVYKYPTQMFLECKCHYGNTLPFNCITGYSDVGNKNKQWGGMLAQSKIKGVKAGVIVWFIDWDLTYFVPIQELEKLRRQGSKSLNIKYLLATDNAVEIPGHKKRILFDYSVVNLLEKL